MATDREHADGDDVNDATPDLDALPFVAPCRILTPFAALRWVRLGFRDYRRALPQSLAYGALIAVASVLVSVFALRFGSHLFLLTMLGGFVFIAPLVCIGLYAISAQLERGTRPSFFIAVREAVHRHIGNELVFTLILTVVFLVWARAGAVMSVFLPTRAHPDPIELVRYFAIGSAVGAVFAGVTFSASAFSLPMIVHRRVDTVTAVVTSVNAVLRNKVPMLVWLALIVLGVALGVATAFVGLAVIVPVIGYAAWHGYLETIDASGFPRHEAGVTAKAVPGRAPTPG